MLEIKPDEFLVGSGDGSVSLVRDMTYRAKQKSRSNLGTSSVVKEPTEQCLHEVNKKMLRLISKC